MAAKGAEASRLASEIISTWLHIDAALAPVIGKRGVAALYERSLHMARAGHPWLGTADGNPETMIDLIALKSVLMQQNGAGAAAGGGAHFQAFYDVLGSLIGLSLTEKLLRSIWEQSFNGPVTEEKLS
ncbi:MAG: hypothetical protein ABIQ90_11240 [Polaromonas sp.]